jgi:hypothetical protein
MRSYLIESENGVIDYSIVFNNDEVDLMETIFLNFEEEKYDQVENYITLYGRSFVEDQLKHGISIEMEHTEGLDEYESLFVAMKIMLDHIVESIYYYQELSNMEYDLGL